MSVGTGYTDDIGHDRLYQCRLRVSMFHGPDRDRLYRYNLWVPVFSIQITQITTDHADIGCDDKIESKMAHIVTDCTRMGYERQCCSGTDDADRNRPYRYWSQVSAFLHRWGRLQQTVADVVVVGCKGQYFMDKMKNDYDSDLIIRRRCMWM